MKAGDIVGWSALGMELITHHHAHRDEGGARALAHDRVHPDDPPDVEGRAAKRAQRHEARKNERLTVVRELRDGTVRVRHPDGHETERHPALLRLVEG